MNPRRNNDDIFFGFLDPVQPDPALQILPLHQHSAGRKFRKFNDEFFENAQVGREELVRALKYCDRRYEKTQNEKLEELQRCREEEAKKEFAEQKSRLATMLYTHEVEKRKELEKIHHEDAATLDMVKEHGFQAGSEQMRRALEPEIQHLESTVQSLQDECKLLTEKLAERENQLERVFKYCSYLSQNLQEPDDAPRNINLSVDSGKGVLGAANTLLKALRNPGDDNREDNGSEHVSADAVSKLVQEPKRKNKNDLGGKQRKQNKYAQPSRKPMLQAMQGIPAYSDANFVLDVDQEIRSFRRYGGDPGMAQQDNLTILGEENDQSSTPVITIGGGSTIGLNLAASAFVAKNKKEIKPPPTIRRKRSIWHRTIDEVVKPGVAPSPATHLFSRFGKKTQKPSLKGSKKPSALRLTEVSRLDNYVHHKWKEEMGRSELMQLFHLYAQKEEFKERIRDVINIEELAAAAIQRFWRYQDLRPPSAESAAASGGAPPSINSAGSRASTSCLKGHEKDGKLAISAAEEYRQAFIRAGGDRLEEDDAIASFPAFKRAKEMIEELREERAVFRKQQDKAFEILRIYDLYDETCLRDKKMQHEVQRLAMLTNGVYHKGKLKGVPRSMVKCLIKYGNNMSHLRDVMRASIVYDDVEKLFDGVAFIIKTELKNDRADFVLLEVDDRMSTKVGDSEYRDVQFIVSVDGLVGEVQLHIKQLFETKHSGHKVYANQRKQAETIFESVASNERVYASWLIRQYPSLCSNVKDKNGRSCLHYSAIFNAKQITRELIRAGMDPWKADDENVIPLELAIRRGFFSIAIILLRAMESTSAKCNNVDTGSYSNNLFRSCRYYIDMAAFDPPRSIHLISMVGKKLYDLLCPETRINLVKWLNVCAHLGEVNRVRELLRMGVHRVNITHAFEHALEAGHVAVVQEMVPYLPSFPYPRATTMFLSLCQKIPPIKLKHTTNQKDNNNKRTNNDAKRGTAAEDLVSHIRLMKIYTNSQQSIDFIRRRLLSLLYAGADVAKAFVGDDADDKGTYVGPAAWSTVDKGSLIVGTPEDHLTFDACGRTPLMMFAAFGDPECCTMLLDFAASPCSRDAYGGMAEDYANSQGHLELASERLAVPSPDANSSSPHQRSSSSHPLQPTSFAKMVNQIAQSGCAGALYRLLLQDRTLATTKTLTASEWSLIHYSVSRKAQSNDAQVLCLRVLLHFNVDPNTEDLNGYTALHWAGIHANELAFAVLMRDSSVNEKRRNLKGGETAEELLWKKTNSKTRRSTRRSTVVHSSSQGALPHTTAQLGQGGSHTMPTNWAPNLGSFVEDGGGAMGAAMLEGLGGRVGGGVCVHNEYVDYNMSTIEQSDSQSLIVFPLMGGVM